MAHLGDAAGVVGNRSVGVYGKLNPRRRQHAQGRDRDAVEARLRVGDKDRGDQNDDWQRRRLHPDGQTADDVRGATGQAVPGDALCRPLRLSRVVLGDQADQEAGHKARDRGQEDSHVPELLALDDVLGVPQQPAGREPGHDQHDSGSREGAQVQGVLRVAPLPGAHQEGRGQRHEDAEAGQEHRQQDQIRCELLAREGRRADSEDERADDGADVGLEQIGAHAGHVADVVAHVVGDHRRVARIVLRNTGFDLADEVGADIGGLRVDAAADACEQRDRRSAEGEARQYRHHLPQRLVVAAAEHRGVQQVEQRQAQDAEPHHREAHHRAAREGNRQGPVQAGAGGRGGPDVGRGGDPHAEEPRQTRTQGAAEHGDPDPRGAARAVGIDKRQPGGRRSRGCGIRGPGTPSRHRECGRRSQPSRRRRHPAG